MPPNLHHDFKPFGGGASPLTLTLRKTAENRQKNPLFHQKLVIL